MQVWNLLCFQNFLRVWLNKCRNHLNPNVHAIGWGEAVQRKCKRLEFGGNLGLWPCKWLTSILEWLSKLGHNLLDKPALTEVLCVSCVNAVYCSAVTKCVCHMHMSLPGWCEHG
jgi:hypothetical protein